jgi:hypothetical protein
MKNLELSRSREGFRGFQAEVFVCEESGQVIA